jgi:maltoporin
MKTNTARTLAALVVLLAPAAGAIELHGYFRDSEGFNGRGGSQACFQLPGSYFKARLGNECDRYLEMTLSETGKFDTIDWRIEFMPASYLPSIDIGAPNTVFVQQMWLGVKFNDWNGATLWAGRRYWKRHDVHSLDWFYWNPAQGNAAVGIEDVDVKIGKLAVSAFRVDATTAPAATANLTQGTYAVPEVRLYDIPLYPTGTLEVGVDLAIAIDQGRSLGPNRANLNPLVSIQHNQAKLLGGSNTLVFQFGLGAMARATGDGPGQLIAGGTTDDRQWRIIEHLVVNPVPAFSGALVLAYQDQMAPNGGGARIFTAEVRPAVHFTDWFKIQADLFYQMLWARNSGEGAGAPSLFKATLAPTIVLGREYYSRPELRLFATYATWNEAAVAAAGSNPIANGAFGSALFGFTFGASVEIWF